MIVVSRYTESGKYPEFAETLRASCERFGLRYDIQTMPIERDWHTTDINKPEWLLDAMFLSRTSVLWLDADCEIMQYPTLLIDPSCTFACYNWYGDPDNSLRLNYDPNRLLPSGGVLFFRYDAAAIELLLRWHQMCPEAKPEEGSDPPLGRAYNFYRPPVRPLWLPKSYNRMDSKWPDVEPVINHVFRNRTHQEVDDGCQTASA